MRSERRPKWESVPRPCGPRTPKPWASSIISQASSRSAQRQHLRQRCYVAVHAEHGVGDDQFAPCRRRTQFAFQRLRVGMRVAPDLGARQAHGVDQRGVVEAVGEQRVARPDQRRDDAQIGHVAGGEVERARQADKPGEPLLQRVMRRLVTADEVRRAGADTVVRRGGLHRGDQIRMRRQPEVVVAAKAQQRAAVDHRLRPAGRLGGTAPPQQGLSAQILELPRNIPGAHASSPSTRSRTSSVPAASASMASSSIT